MSIKPARFLQLLPAATERRAASVGEYQAFPVELLPAAAGDFVREVARAFNCDPACVALPALAAMASAVGNTRRLRLKRGWDEPCIIWSAVIGPAGSGKAPALRRAVHPLVRRQRAALLEYRAKSPAYGRAVDLQERDLRRKRSLYPDVDELPDRPKLEQLVCDCTDVRALAEILEDNPRGTLFVRHDLGDWLMPFTRRGSRPAARDLNAWLMVHTGGLLYVGRGKQVDRQHYVLAASVSIAGSMRPSILTRSLRPDVSAARLISRMLLAMPPSVPARWSDYTSDITAEQGYGGLLGKLQSLEFDKNDSWHTPCVLTLSAKAEAAWKAFYDDWQSESAAAHGLLAAARSKIPAYAARLTLLHHVVERALGRENDLEPITRDSAERGIALARWFAGEAKRIYALVAESTAKDADDDLIEVIQLRGGRITVRELMRASSRRYFSSAVAESALNGLVESGLAIWSEGGCQNGGENTRDECA